MILPNLGFSALWLIGSPPRYPDIIAIGAVGLIVRGRNAATQFLSLLAMIIYTMLMFICRLFGMGPTYLLQASQFLGELNPMASPEYIAVIAIFIVTLLSAAWACRRPMNFNATRSLMIAIGVVGLMGLLDFAISFGSRGSYQHDAPIGTKFESAAMLSHFAERADRKRNLVLVTVEAMGMPREPLIASRLFASFDRPEFLARYNVLRGRTRYFGTTTNAEIRELCGYWGNYFPLLDRSTTACLPARLAHMGYQTTAVHAFEGNFFQRATWYPHIGFEHVMFHKALVRAGADECAGVFEGACDRDIPAIIAKLLKAAKSPQFVYWLTLNSHLPVPASFSLHTDKCADFAPELAKKRPMACRMLLLWAETFGGLAHEMTQPDFPETDVLIVGDHMPPFSADDKEVLLKNMMFPGYCFALSRDLSPLANNGLDRLTFLYRNE